MTFSTITLKKAFLIYPGDKIIKNDAILTVKGVAFRRPYYYDIKVEEGVTISVLKNELVKVLNKHNNQFTEENKMKKVYVCFGKTVLGYGPFAVCESRELAILAVKESLYALDKHEIMEMNLIENADQILIERMGVV